MRVPSGRLTIWCRLVVSGIAIMLPYIAFELWLFIAPGIRPRERKMGLVGIPFATILFLGGMRVRWFAGLGALLCAGFAVLVVTSPYRLQRIFGFMDPWSDAFGKGYQLSHALIAFGRGEIFGQGLGNSLEKLYYLPEAHTDFLMAVIGEELGFVGVAIVIFGFFWLTRRASGL